MRNLKRALSLTLASVMLLGMMVVGSSAAAGYSDVDIDDNVEAIEVLQAVEVMVGDDRGFGPDRPVTRNEMAVVMGKLLNLDYNYYSASCPFTDVADWAKGWVGAAAANGIVSGRGNGIYDGEATVTAVEAASMMMRALGYFKYQNDYADGFITSTVRQGTKIGIFDMVGTDGTSAMTRNQVAQMTLNALQSGMVEPDGNTINLTTPDGSVFTGKVNYVYVTSKKDFAHAISWTEATSAGSTNNGYIVELGEQLYNGKLHLEENERDDFLRPARKWEYDGKAIGTYMKKENIRKEYTAKVTGKDIYDLLGAATIKDYNAIYGAIDGEYTPVSRASLVRTNTDAILNTEKGVLTQVFVDSEDKVVDIVAINTFLAQATEDYDEKNGEVDLDVHAMNNTGDKKAPVYVKDKTLTKATSITVDVDDIDVSEVKEDDFYLITVAQGKVQTMTAPEVLSKVEINSFNLHKDVTVDGTTYQYADTAKYDYEVLDDYDDSNLKDVTYNVFLDRYGYLIGVEQNEDPDQFVFITGSDGNNSNLSAKKADMNAIFLDGRMETITVDTGKSTGITHGSQVNSWYTYGLRSDGSYTLKPVPTTMTATDKFAQSSTDVTGSDEVKIDKKNVTLAGDGTKFTVVYGNDDSVYLNVTTKAIETKDAATHSWRLVIDDVDSITTGVKNASLVVKNAVPKVGGGTAGSDEDHATPDAEEIFTLFNDKGYVIAAVTIGDDDGVSKNFVYITSDNVKRESYDKAADKWTWTREAVVNGELTDLKEIGDSKELSLLSPKSTSANKLLQGEWFEIKFDADGYVKKAEKLTSALDGTATDGYVNDVSLVQAAVTAKDNAILWQQGFTAVAGTDSLTYKNGTLYVKTDGVKGFSVSPDVKVVLCLSNGKTGSAHKDFDDCDDGYKGYAGLERALRDLDSNFTGHLSAVFENGVATVIIFNDTTAGTSGNNGGGEGDADVNKDPTAGYNIDEYAGTMDVDYVHGAKGGAQKVAEDALIADGFTIKSVAADGKITATKNGVDRVITPTATEYFKITVDSTVYYVKEDGKAKGDADEYTLDMSKTDGRTGTGYINGKGTPAYAAYAADGTDANKVAITSLVDLTSGKITNNATVKTGYVEVTVHTTAVTGTPVTGGLAIAEVKNTAVSKGYAVAGTGTVTVTANAKDADTGTVDSYLTLADTTSGADSSITAPAKVKVEFAKANAAAGQDVSWTITAGQKDIKVQITLSDS